MKSREKGDHHCGNSLSFGEGVGEKFVIKNPRLSIFFKGGGGRRFKNILLCFYHTYQIYKKIQIYFSE